MQSHAPEEAEHTAGLCTHRVCMKRNGTNFHAPVRIMQETERTLDVACSCMRQNARSGIYAAIEHAGYQPKTIADAGSSHHSPNLFFFARPFLSLSKGVVFCVVLFISKYTASEPILDTIWTRLQGRTSVSGPE